MSMLGIYFGLKSIVLVETKGRKIVNHLQIASSTFAAGGAEEKVPTDIKIVALFKDEMRKNKIDAREAAICLSGKDLIIRTFEIPSLPASELANAINFEAKKYIPFKVEELVYDFQVQFDKISRRNMVLFVGIKKETLDKYLSILSQLNLRVSTIEYSAFSILRFIQLSAAVNKGIIGVISTDFQEEDEVHFTILENGFPLFSRDITLMVGRSDELTVADKLDPARLLEKLKTEIRISLDYYDRKLPTKTIESIFLVCSEDYRQSLESGIKEIGLHVNFLEVSKFLDKPLAFSLNFIKSYSCALSKVIKTKLKIDLLSAKAKSREGREIAFKLEALSFLQDIKIYPTAVVLGLFILAATVAWGQYRLIPLNKELKYLLSQRPALKNINPDSSYQELENLDADYKKKIEMMSALVKKHTYVTEQLEILPTAVPEGVWITGYNFRKDEARAELTLRGVAYLGDNDKELRVINTFISNLKENAKFSKNYTDISIVGIERSEQAKIPVSGFTVVCTESKGRR